MKIFVAFLAFVALSEGGVSVNNPSYCYSTDVIRPQNRMHSVRTSYEAVRRTQVNPTVSGKFDAYSRRKILEIIFVISMQAIKILVPWKAWRAQS